MDATAQAKIANSPFPHPFVLFRPSMDRMIPTCIGEDNLTQSTDSNVNLLWKLPRRHNWKYFYQLSGDPLVQSSCHIKLTITFPSKENTAQIVLSEHVTNSVLDVIFVTARISFIQHYLIPV